MEGNARKEASPLLDNNSVSFISVARNCKELLQKGFTISDWYTIFPDGKNPLKVLCDMHTDGGGWIVSENLSRLKKDKQRA